MVLGSTVVQNTTFVFILYSRYVSGGFSLVDCSSCLLMCRCAIVVFLNISIFLLISFSVRPGHVFRKPYLMALRRLAVVRLNSASYKYCASYGFDVFVIMLFFTASDC